MAVFDGDPKNVAAQLGVSSVEEVLEENELYAISIAQGEGRDHWFWEPLAAPGSIELSFQVGPGASGESPAELEVWLEGATADDFSSIDHHTAVILNDVLLGEALDMLMEDQAHCTLAAMAKVRVRALLARWASHLYNNPQWEPRLRFMGRD